jgi:RimJ/RimL family protein N-acetyltransferase
MSPITITPANESHYPSLYQAIASVAREERYLSFTQPLPWHTSLAFYRSLAAAGAPHLLALDGDKVVGWADITSVFGDSRAHIGVLGIGIIPGYRDQGLGARLLQAIIDTCWAKGLTRIELTVRTDNPRAIALYERLGFQHEGTRRHANLVHGQYIDAHIMGLLKDQA